MSESMSDVTSVGLRGPQQSSGLNQNRTDFSVENLIGLENGDFRDISSELYRMRIENNIADKEPVLEQDPIIGDKSLSKNSQSADPIGVLMTSMGAKVGSSANDAFSAHTESGDHKSNSESEREREDIPGIPTLGGAKLESSGTTSQNSMDQSMFSSMQTDNSIGSSEKIANIRDLMDKAQLLVTKGGGSMKIELGGGNPMSLAIKVLEGEVSIKIATENDRIRDLIAAEIPSLQESMASQNLKLTQVDLGKNMNSGSHENKNGSGQFSQQFEFQQGSQRKNPSNQDKFLAEPSFRNSSSVIEGSKIEKIGKNSLLPVINNVGKLLVRV